MRFKGIGSGAVGNETAGHLQVVTLQEGDTVTVEYLEGTPVCTVLNLE